MGWFTWFSKKEEEPEDYEQILSQLAQSVSSKQTRLSEIRLRERRSTLLVTLYALGVWVLYVTLWWTILPKFHFWQPSPQHPSLEAFIKALPTAIGPVIILFVRRIVQIWYARKSDTEEKELRSLLQEQKKKIVEIKKKTNFDNTRNLLERYGEGGGRRDPNTPNNLRQRQAPSSTPNGPQTPVIRAPPGARSTKQERLDVDQTRRAAVPVNQSPLSVSLLAPSSTQPLPSPKKHWYDKVADALLGDDSASTPASNKTKFALVCENCFAHNGLCREEDWDDMKYTCPNCNYFNPSPRQKRGDDPSYAHSRAQSLLRGSRPASQYAASTAPNSAHFSTIPPEFRGGNSIPPSAMFSNVPAEFRDSIAPSDNERGRTLSPPVGFSRTSLHPPSSPLRATYQSSSPSSSPSPPSRDKSRTRSNSAPGSDPKEQTGDGSAMDIDVHS